MNKHVAVRITQAYRDKLALLAMKNRRSMAQELMAMIDYAEKSKGLEESK